MFDIDANRSDFFPVQFHPGEVQHLNNFCLPKKKWIIPNITKKQNFPFQEKTIVDLLGESSKTLSVYLPIGVISILS